MVYEEKKMTDNSFENLGNLAAAIITNKHFLSQHFGSENIIFIDTLIQHLICHVYAKFCNLFSESVPSEKLNKDIERAFSKIEIYYNGIEKLLQETPKTDD